MANFKIVLCENSACGLRFPIDLDLYRAKFCPRCGAPLRVVRDLQPHKGLLQDSQKSRRNLTVLLDSVRSAYNVGAIFRTADGVGVQKLCLCGITPTPDDTPGVAKTALGAESHILWEYHPNALRIARQLQEEGLQLLALERTANALPLMAYHPNLGEERAVVLVLGNEQAGVDPDILNLCDAILSIPMSGEKASLNVSVAFGVAAYWLSFG
mgnify:CR=1 FL=1